VGFQVILELPNDETPRTRSGRLTRDPASAEALELDPRVPDAVQRHHQLVWRTLRRLGVAPDDADDAAQHVFWTFSQRAADVEIGREEQFLLAVAIRVAANARRKVGRRQEVATAEVDATSSEPSPEALVAQKQLREQLDRGLLSLSLDQRAIFVLFEIEGYSLPEIARMLGIPLGTASSRLHRARGHFAAWLRANHSGDER
jgi:RNA polymerase sigma-70 factor (ECF subfamily)